MKKYLLLLFTVCLIQYSFAETVYDVREYVLGTLIQVFDPMSGGEGYNDLEALKSNDRRNSDCVVQDIKTVEGKIHDALWWYWVGGNDENTIQKVMKQEIEKFVDKTSFETAMRN